MSSQEILKQLAHSVGYSNYVIAKERHRDGGSHSHVLITNTRKYQIKDQNKLNHTFKWNSIHGNYQAANSIKVTAEYIAKEKQYETNFENFSHGRFLDPIQDLIYFACEEGTSQSTS